jgi:HAD superfamily hydrolase (TIGR01509 family)
MLGFVLVLPTVALLSPGRGVRFASRTAGPSMATKTAALLFDCDGVIVETEELHRLAYNKAFNDFGLEVGGKQVDWTVPYYDQLQNTVGGGKPKMRWYFMETCGGEWPVCTKRDGRTPASEAEGMALIDELQDTKTEFYKGIVDQAAEARPGVLELMDAAIAAPNLAVGICSAATRGGFDRVVNSIVGKQRLAKLDVVIAGDDVTAKKPDPMIYNLAAERLGLGQTDCVVIEDSLVGLRAATSAGMPCLITYTASTAAEDFYAEGAAAKVPDLGVGVTLEQLFDVPAGAPLAELASSVRDPRP